jgi:hypothetical protein
MYSGGNRTTVELFPCICKPFSLRRKIHKYLKFTPFFHPQKVLFTAPQRILNANPKPPFLTIVGILSTQRN